MSGISFDPQYPLLEWIEILDRFLWEVGLQRSLSVNSYEVGLQLTLQGVGIGIIPFSTAWRKIQENSLQELRVKDVASLEFGLHDLVICWNANANHPAIPIFIQKIEDYVFYFFHSYT